jgi:hypothetical protein
VPEALRSRNASGIAQGIRLKEEVRPKLDQAGIHPGFGDVDR